MKGHGFERQEETVGRFAGENGYEVAETFRDAFTGTEADRPEFNRMVAAILGNGVRTILVGSVRTTISTSCLDDRTLIDERRARVIRSDTKNFGW